MVAKKRRPKLTCQFRVSSSIDNRIAGCMKPAFRVSTPRMDRCLSVEVAHLERYAACIQASCRIVDRIFKMLIIFFQMQPVCIIYLYYARLPVCSLHITENVIFSVMHTDISHTIRLSQCGQSTSSITVKLQLQAMSCRRLGYVEMATHFAVAHKFKHLKKKKVQINMLKFTMVGR